MKKLCYLIFPFCSMAAQGQEAWTPKPKMPIERFDISAAVVKDTIYLLGGDAIGFPFPRLDAYNAVSATWSMKAPMPTPRRYLFVGVVKDKIYAIGGTTGMPDTAVNIVEEYNPATNTWATKAPMPTKRYFMSGAVIHDKIYIVGGHCADNKVLEVYDPGTDTWTTETPLPATGTQQLNGGAAWGTNFYVFGGNSYPGFDTCYPTISIYNTITKTWSKGADMPEKRYAGSVAVLNDRIHYFGGTNGARYKPSSGNNYSYDPAYNVWHSALDMPFARSHTAAATWNGEIYVLGGTDTVALTLKARDVWSYRPSSLTVLETAVNNHNSKIYPNPTTGLISWDGPRMKEAVVYDLTGKMLIRYKDPEKPLMLDLTKGCYLLNLTTVDGISQKWPINIY